MTRNLLALLAVAAFVPAVAQAQQQAILQPQAASERAGVGLAKSLLEDARVSAVYISPQALPRFSASHSVSLNNHTRPVRLDRVAVGGQDIEAALKTALEQLDAQLRASNSDRNKIVQLDVKFVGNTFDEVMRLSNVVDGYFAARMSYATAMEPARSNARFVDYPVRPIIGVKSLEGDAKVAIEARILDPKAYNAADLVNPNVRMPVLGARQVLIGGITAMQSNYLVAGYGNNDVQADAAIANLQRVLDGVGMDRAGVTKVTAYYMQGVDPEMLRSKLAAQFAGAEIATEPAEAACVEGATVALNAEGELK